MRPTDVGKRRERDTRRRKRPEREPPSYVVNLI